MKSLFISALAISLLLSCDENEDCCNPGPQSLEVAVVFKNSLDQNLLSTTTSGSIDSSQITVIGISGKQGVIDHFTGQHGQSNEEHISMFFPSEHILGDQIILELDTPPYAKDTITIDIQRDLDEWDWERVRPVLVTSTNAGFQIAKDYSMPITLIK